MKFLEKTDQQRETLPKLRGLGATAHVFEKDAVFAINAALAAERPLLIRGEPGTGKSQLARAAAAGLGRAFLSKVIDARTEVRDLFYSFDAVRRLADAQVQAALGSEEPDPRKHQAQVEERLAVANYLEPGPLWWCFSWDSAQAQAARGQAEVPESPGDWSPTQGCVLLLDEIDKADSAVPNGLLEALGHGQFDRLGGEPVTRDEGAEPPLVIVTTNEERSLPNAFLRRCLVLQLALPRKDDELRTWLVGRGRAHFDCEDGVLIKAANLLVEDRKEARSRSLCPPGQAEYLDLLRAVTTQSEDPDEQEWLVDAVRTLTFRKHPTDAA
ncbi:MAG: MoxR family ATPase [Acidobacteriota bacterium]